MADLKPEAVEAIKRLHEQSKALMEALADLARQGAYEFKKAPGREFMDRSEAMRNVLRIRDAHTRLSHGARAALVALGRADGVSVSSQHTNGDHTPMGDADRG